MRFGSKTFHLDFHSGPSLTQWHTHFKGSSPTASTKGDIHLTDSLVVPTEKEISPVFLLLIRYSLFYIFINPFTFNLKHILLLPSLLRSSFRPQFCGLCYVRSFWRVQLLFLSIRVNDRDQIFISAIGSLFHFFSPSPIPNGKML